MNKNTFTAVKLAKGEVNVYDFGAVKLHAYKTNDLIDNEVFIVEKAGKAVILESPCFFDNIDYMNQVGEVFYLKASPETILQHLSMSRGERPLLKDKTPEQLQQFVTEQLAQREPFYSKARHIVDVNVLDSFDKIKFVTQDIANAIG